MYVLPEYALHFALFNFHLVLYETKGGAGLDKCLAFSLYTNYSSYDIRQPKKSSQAIFYA